MAKYLSPETDKHTPGEPTYDPNYTPCGGGTKETSYTCSVCGAMVNANGKPAKHEPPETDKHTPGTTLFKADYTPCGGGHKTDYYYCTLCHETVTADGQIYPSDPPETDIHVPGTEKHSATFTPCGGGIKTEYYTCIYCTQYVDENGYIVSWDAPYQTSGHTIDGVKHPAFYYPCKGGYNSDWYRCALCGNGFLDENGTDLEWTSPSQKHTPGKILHSPNYADCSGGYKEAFYYCSVCGTAVNAKGDEIAYYPSCSLSHTPGTTLYEPDYTLCHTGTPVPYYKCIYCGSRVDADGSFITYKYAMGPHTIGGELHKADYTLCGGGCLVDYYRCAVCNDIIDENGKSLYHTPFDRDPAGDHTLEAISEKAPTYTEDGNKAYWQCSVCKKAFSDEAGETEITDMSTVILPKLEKPRVDIAEGLDKVPETVSKWFPTVSDILEALRKTALEASSQLTDSKDTISILLDVQLQIQNEDGTWTTVTHENFPANGVDTVLPYPAGTSKLGFNFTITHMITSGDRAGEIEVLNYTLEDDGIHVHFDSMSPVMITYNKSEPKKDEPKKDDTKPDSTKKDDAKADNTNASSTDAPKTGDNENYAVWAALLLLSGSAVAVLLKMNRAQRKAKHF